MYYKVAICDDEKIMRDDVIKNISNVYNFDAIITEFSSGEELLASNQDFHLILLDIEMPGISGMDTAFELRRQWYDGMIIFLTSHTEFMPDAFKVKAFRFLSKPINVEKLDEAVSEAKKELINTKHIMVEDKEHTVYLKITDIAFLESVGGGTQIHDKKNNVYETSSPLKFWKDQIGNDFFYQIHKSIIISFFYTGEISKDGRVTVRNTSTVLDISRRNIIPFKEAFNDFIRIQSKVM